VKVREQAPEHREVLAGEPAYRALDEAGDRVVREARAGGGQHQIGTGSHQEKAVDHDQDRGGDQTDDDDLERRRHR